MSSQYRETDKTIFDHLEERGYDYLLPEKSTRFSSREGFGDQYYEPAGFDDEDEDDDRNEVIHPYWDGEGQYSIDDTPFDPFVEEKEYTARDISNLKSLFDCDYMDDEDFLHSNPWQHMDLTAKQFAMIDPDLIDDGDFYDFVMYMKDVIIQDIFPSAEQRIKVCTLLTASKYRAYGREPLMYCYRVFKASKDMNEALILMQLFADYEKAIVDAQQYNDRFIANMDNPGHQYIKYPEFPRPSHLKDYHDKAVRDQISYMAEINRLQDERLAQVRKMTNEKIKERIRTPEYLSLLYTDGKYTVQMAQSEEDLMYEGEKLDHCVGSYGPVFASGQSDIYFIRRTDDINTPFYTAEIKHGYMYTALTQLYGYRDTTDKTPEFRRFVMKWCEEKHIRVKCEV